VAVRGRERFAAVTLCAVVLAAGEGRRLRPLTLLRPKALCPVGNVPLLDRVLDRLAAVGLIGPDSVAVNASYLGEQVVAHVDGRAHPSLEAGGPLGTAGGVGRLRDWIGGRGVLVGNADAYLAPAKAPTSGPPSGADLADPADPADLADLVAGWDGDSVRLLGGPAGPGAPPEFGAYRFAGFSLLPWRLVRDLRPEPSDLVRTVWRPADAAGILSVVPYRGRYLDTGTPANYLHANMHAIAAGPVPPNSVRVGHVAGAEGPTLTELGTELGEGRPGASLVDTGATITGRLDRAVVGAGATVRGEVTRGVVWPSGYVGPDEHLVDAVRAGRDLTVPSEAPLA
jgi:N-acetyl-alpha-D-muramate 1-phosphate uridylyltransferase